MKSKREDLIHSISMIRDSKDLPSLNNIDDLRVVMKMNQECRECSRSVYHYGQCTGRASATPCLIFKQKAFINPVM